MNFNVINSDYYCQTEDEEPKHPGELGKKTLLGIDSDVDGIRDDVEIWINNNTSNTPHKDLKELRIALKIYAKTVSSLLRYKDSNKAADAFKEERIAKRCVFQIIEGSPNESILEKLNLVYFNTEIRFDEFMLTSMKFVDATFMNLKGRKIENCSLGNF